MKKDKLIELLQTIEGNPDIYIWNGYVEDYMDISKDFDEIQTGVESLSFITHNLKSEVVEFLKRDLTPEEDKNIEIKANELKKSRKREIVSHFLEEDQFKVWYGNSVKTAYLLSPKLRGLSSYGRDGNLKY